LDRARVIGVTGQTGAGKSLITGWLREAGCPAIDCDAFAKEVMDGDPACIGEISDAFPGCVRDGVIDRGKLGPLVFSDPEKLAALNEIVNPRILRALKETIDGWPEGEMPLIVDGATLIETGAADLCGFLVAVTCSAAERIKRIVARDNISENQARDRVASQREDRFYAARADWVIDNSAGPQAAEEAAGEVLRRWKERL